MRNVLLTGAAGRLGNVLTRGLLSDDLNLRLTDRVPTMNVGTDTPYRCCELSNLDELVILASGADTIVHVAGIPDEAPFGELDESNIVATYNVFEAARLAGVRRVVYASSAHVVGMYPPTAEIVGNTLSAPDSLYAVTKLFGESLGSLYSAKHGISVVILRIGSFRPAPENSRQLRTWLSHLDAVALFDRAIRAQVEA